MSTQYNLNNNVTKIDQCSDGVGRTVCSLSDTTTTTPRPTIPVNQIFSFSPTLSPTTAHPTTSIPTNFPTNNPTKYPTYTATFPPTYNPTIYPTYNPTHYPTYFPTEYPTYNPTRIPSINPTNYPTYFPTMFPTLNPTIFFNTTINPKKITNKPTTNIPTLEPTINPTIIPTLEPTKSPEILIQPTIFTETNNNEISNNNPNQSNNSSNNAFLRFILLLTFNIILFSGIILSLYCLYAKGYCRRKIPPPPPLKDVLTPPINAIEIIDDDTFRKASYMYNDDINAVQIQIPKSSADNFENLDIPELLSPHITMSEILSVMSYPPLPESTLKTPRIGEETISPSAQSAAQKIHNTAGIDLTESPYKSGNTDELYDIPMSLKAVYINKAFKHNKQKSMSMNDISKVSLTTLEDSPSKNSMKL